MTESNLIHTRKELPHDRSFIEPMRELKESVESLDWYEMDVNSNGQMIKVMGKGKTLNYPDGWKVMYCIYDQGRYIKKTVQISIKDHIWTDVPKEERHGRANVILDTLFNPDNDLAETAILPNGGIQLAQDEPKNELIMVPKETLQ